MARKLDLRTGKPVWFAYRAPSVPVEKPGSGTLNTDVLIVGIGIGGAMMAEALTAQGHSVICIDRRGAMKGSTPATTALIQFEIDEPLTSLSRMIGQDRARQAWRRSRLAVTNLHGRIGELGIACDLVPRSSLYLAGNVLGPTELQAEAAARRLAGIASTYLSAAQLKERFGIARKGAVLSQDNLALDPRKLTAGLLRKAQERGARFFAPLEAGPIHATREDMTVETMQGPRIRARHVVLATGYELLDLVPAAAHKVISTWAIATRPQPRALWPGAGFIWEASDPYLYMRATADGRVICGGEDEDFVDEEARDTLIDAKTKRIAAKLGRLFPNLDTTAEFAWAGAFGTTTTGLPYIGALPRHPRIFSVMGYGGNGITYAQIASEIIPAAIAGKEDSDAALFGFSR